MRHRLLKGHKTLLVVSALVPVADLAEIMLTGFIGIPDNLTLPAGCRRTNDSHDGNVKLSFHVAEDVG